MDEDMDTSVDTADVDTSDMDTSSDIDTSDVAEDIPDDVPEDIPEDDYSDYDDDIEEEIPEDTEEDDVISDTEDAVEDIPEDIDDETVEETDDLPDEVPEDTLDEETIESDDTSDEIAEDIEEDELTDANDDLPDEIPEDIPDTEEVTEDDNTEVAIYSQDPKWRELQSAAFPDYELPPVLQANEGVEFNENAFDAVPEDRRDAVADTFQEAPAGIKSAINDLSEELTVGDTRTYRDLDGNVIQECCHYSPSDDIIRMNPNYDNDEYAEVFRHEYGHFADTKLGDLSTSDEFIKAMNDDIAQFASDDSLKGKMLDQLSSNSAIDDRCVSDILSGSFNNDPEIIDRYKSEYADYWSHSNDYWSGARGPQNARERETFANMFSVYSGEGRNDSISFLEKYYPSTTKQFRSYFKI